MSDDSTTSKQKPKKGVKIHSTLNYGYAPLIIENKGKYFWLKIVFSWIANKSRHRAEERCKTCKTFVMQKEQASRGSSLKIISR